MRITDALLLKKLHHKPIAGGGPEVMKCEKVHTMQEFSQSDLNKCRDEKLKLQAVVADLKQVNRRWQTYNNDMQVFIKRLQSTIQDQQEQLNNMADSHEERRLHSHKDDRQETSCRKCQPVIEYLKNRISHMENELTELESRQGYSVHTESSELLSLQLRLRQACEHIDYLNRIMLNKGILKTDYNFLPEPHHSVGPCSLDELKFYECDSESIDTESMASKEICSRSDVTSSRPDTPSTSWEDAREESDQISDRSSKITHLRPSLTQPSLNISDKRFKDSFNSRASEKPNLDKSLLDLSDNTQDICKQQASKENTREVNYSVKIPPDRLNMNLYDVDTQSTSSGAESSSIDSTSRFNQSLESNYNPLIHSSFSFFNSPIDCSSTSQLGNTSKLDLSLGSYNLYSTSPLHKTSKYWDEDDIMDRRDILGTYSPIICPHCRTIFPPDSKDTFSQHLITCQYL